jgi:hypothetical protein
LRRRPRTGSGIEAADLETLGIWLIVGSSAIIARFPGELHEQEAEKAVRLAASSVAISGDG